MIKGVTNASLRESENSAHARERLHIVVSTGVSSLIHLFNIHDGIGSSTQDFDGDLDMTLRTSSQLIGLNSEKGVPENSDRATPSLVSLVLLDSKSPRIFDILSEKKDTNLSANSFAQLCSGRTTF